MKSMLMGYLLMENHMGAWIFIFLDLEIPLDWSDNSASEVLIGCRQKDLVPSPELRRRRGGVEG